MTQFNYSPRAVKEFCEKHKCSYESFWSCCISMVNDREWDEWSHGTIQVYQGMDDLYYVSIWYISDYPDSVTGEPKDA